MTGGSQQEGQGSGSSLQNNAERNGWLFSYKSEDIKNKNHKWWPLLVITTMRSLRQELCCKFNARLSQKKKKKKKMRMRIGAEATSFVL